MVSWLTRHELNYVFHMNYIVSSHWKISVFRNPSGCKLLKHKITFLAPLVLASLIILLLKAILDLKYCCRWFNWICILFFYYQLFALGVISSPDLEFDTDCLKYDIDIFVHFFFIQNIHAYLSSNFQGSVIQWILDFVFKKLFWLIDDQWMLDFWLKS